MINSYNVVLTDKNGPVSYEIGRVNLTAFIAGVNWETVTSLTVEPIKSSDDWPKVFSMDDLDETSEWDDVFLEKGKLVLEEQRVAKQEVLRRFAPAEEWKTIEKLPTRSFEINRAGKIRHKHVKKILSPSLDLDSRNYMTVNLKINGMDYYIDGPALANEMWSVPV